MNKMPLENKAHPGSRSGAATRIFLVVAAIILLIVAAKRFDLQQVFRDALAWISGLGPLAPLIFIVLYILACVLLVPGSILTLGAGVLFGVFKGSITVSIGATLGATCAFLVGRYVARGWVVGRMAGDARFQAIDEAVAWEGWKIVLLTRLSPMLPFNLLNYAFGLTQVSLRDYVLASWIGMLPGTILYVYIGSLAGSLAELAASGRTRTPIEWALYGVGLLATLAVTVYVTRIARRALSRKIKRSIPPS